MLYKRPQRNIVSFITKFSAVTLVFSVGVILLGSLFAGTYDNSTATVSETEGKGCIIVIDPGHGGEDGGAVAIDGTVEKDLNLEFSKTLDSLCGLLGIKSVLTRDTDTLLYDKYNEFEDYKGKKKVYDLKNRLRFTEEQGDEALFVGIHMNKFPSEKYSGTQVYFSPNNSNSQTLAQNLRDSIIHSLQPENDREIKKAGSSIFLLKRLTVPAVLIECGFLSNEAETARLKSTEYKKEFSLTTAAALGEFIKASN